ncbi:haloacid dehalogenase type II [Pontibacillus salipaludis]|uniref:Haloacid dehalogenase n=1 Tax=Pontibacillus salipaludis TaxID=1697394 RepID=A0ABQ1Q3M2_9BACI|nr:haloacid dehalogenase type II [Pontibacillus salipaludis]GGD11071.1 haloacid dehalogenase [Pontibacillus salipaludis]
MTTPIKAFIFDVYGTLFDVHTVKEKCEEFFPEKGEAISQSWRQKQLEYFFLYQVMGKYRRFPVVTMNALHYAVKKHGEEITQEQSDALMDAYLHLDHYEEVEEVLGKLENYERVVFSNGTPETLTPLLEHAGLTDYIDDVLSVDGIKQFKPSQDSYLYALDQLGVKREEVLFMSSNGWDISGAKNFGFQTAWINRNRLPVEELNLEPDKIYEDLNGILEWTENN